MIARLVAAALTLCAVAAQAAPLRILTPMLPDTRGNPHSYIGLPFALVSQAVFEPMVEVGRQGKVEPGLFESWVQEAPQRWVFKLKPGVVFSNGERFDTAAVLAAFNYVLTTTAPADALSSATMRSKIATVSARDDLTLVIDTKVIDPILPLHLYNMRVPAPAAWAKGIESFAAAPVGTGPYRVTKWSPASVQLVPNATARKPGTVSEIEVRAIPDQAARALALSSGSADIAIDIPAEAAADFSDPGIRLVARAANLVTMIQFVTVGNSPLKDVRVRQAINYAIDRKKLIHIFLNDAVAPATQFTHENAFGFNTALKPYPYDPAKAKALLAEAGYPKDVTIVTSYVTGYGADDAIYQQLSADLAAVGVKMEFRPVTLSTWMGHLYAGDWPGAAFITGVQGYDPINAFTTRSCDWAKPYHCDPGMTPLLKAARVADVADVMRQRMEAIMAYEHDNPPGAMLWPRASFDGLGPRVQTYKAAQDQLDYNVLTAVEK